MSRKVIAVDIDDVLTAEAEFIIEYSNKHWGHNLSFDDYYENWSEMWGIDFDETERRAKELHMPGIVTQYRLIPQGREVLEGLAKRYKLVVITSRRQSVVDETLGWLRENFGNIFAEVRFTGFWDTLKQNSHMLTKGELLKDMKVNYLIDDQPKHCLAAAEEGIEAVLFGDYGVSRKLQLPKGVTRCKDWKAVQEYFEGKDE